MQSVFQVDVDCVTTNCYQTNTLKVTQEHDIMVETSLLMKLNDYVKAVLCKPLD
jgi:hypothetical protein